MIRGNGIPQLHITISDCARLAGWLVRQLLSLVCFSFSSSTFVAPVISVHACMFDTMNHHPAKNHRSRRLRGDEEHRRHGRYETRGHSYTEQTHRRSQLRDRRSVYSNSSWNADGWDSRNDTGNDANQGMIENWLSNISRRGVISPKAVDTQHQEQEPILARSPGWRPHNIELDNLRQGHKRSRSRDGSFIADASRNSTRVAPLRGRQHEAKLPFQEQKQQRNGDQVAKNTCLSSFGTPSPDFKKRARHKTRDDRYDSNKQPWQRQRRSRKERYEQPEAPPRKRVLSSGKDVMDSFHSEAILQDRLTLQPNISHGLFQNGRISTLNPVEELAYNSFTAAENPICRVSSRAQHNKHRAKDKQHRGREVDGMVAYFERKETPPNELLPVIPTEAPVSSAHRGFGTHPKSDHLDRRRKADRTPTESFERGLALRADEARLRPQSSGPLSLSALIPRTNSMATSYVSWSTSEQTQPLMPRACNGRDASSTPETIRNGLRETGVFNGTGKSMSGRETSAVSVEKSKSRERLCVDTGMSARPCRDSHQASPVQLGIIRYQDKGVMTAADLPPLPNDQLEVKLAELPSNGHNSACDRGVSSSKGSVDIQQLLSPMVAADNSDQNGQGVSSKLTPDQRNEQGLIANHVAEQMPVDIVPTTTSTQTPTGAKQPQLHVPVPDDDICGNGDSMEAVAPARERADEAFCKLSTTIERPGRNLESREAALRSQQAQHSRPLSVTIGAPSLSDTTWRSSTLCDGVLIRDHIPGPSTALYDEYTDFMGAQPLSQFGSDEKDAFRPPLPLPQEPRFRDHGRDQIVGNREPSRRIDTPLSQPRESLADFIARAEQDAFGNRYKEGATNSYHGTALNDTRLDIRYPKIPYTENHLRNELAVSERQPEHSSWHIMDSVNKKRKRTERLPVAGYNRGFEIDFPPNRTQLNQVDQDDELEEVRELWPPNLF